MSNDSGKRFLQSPLGVALVGGIFAIGVAFLSAYLTKSREPYSGQELLFKERLLREREEARREKLVANCKRTAEGRYEAALLVELLTIAVRKGTEKLGVGENAQRACRNSQSISWEYLDGVQETPVLWIDAPDGEEGGGRLLCGCYPGPL